MTNATQLYYDGKLMNTITVASQFSTMPNRRFDTAEQREEAARIQMQGWIQNANYDRTKFEIRHVKTPPIKLSPMVADIITRSRENLGT